jgi:hypothetical protein
MDSKANKDIDLMNRTRAAENTTITTKRLQ